MGKRGDRKEKNSQQVRQKGEGEEMSRARRGKTTVKILQRKDGRKKGKRLLVLYWKWNDREE